MTPASPAPPPAAPPAECPIEAVLPDGHHPCTLPRGHATGHDFADEPRPWDAQPDPVASRGYNPNIGGRPQEAATPIEALAAELEAEARSARSPLTADLELEGAQVRRVIAARVRELAPAWDALAAECGRLRAAHDEMAGHLNSIALIITRYEDEELNAITAFAEVMDTFGGDHA